ncbi:MAG TPA: cation:dicarboxylase symporter family transporter [Candidatus Angelobacter sp.]|nr:cation:dicarboxylase symporter family transporter [Candidatus Angelobacter sp.]
MKKNLLLIGLAAITLAALLTALAHWTALAIPESVLMTARWAAIAVLIAYAFVRRSLTPWILVSMLAGAEFGHDWPQAAAHLKLLSQIFLRLITLIIAPLIFGTLVSGIAGHPDLKKVGRLGIKSIFYFEVVTTLALLIGLAAINISKAGAGVHLPASITSEASPAPARPSASEIILHIFPENIAKSVAEGQVLQVVIFSILFGISLALVPQNRRTPMLQFCESLSEVMFRFTNLVMLYAPIGIGAAIAFTVSQGGLKIIGNLFQLLVTLYCALLAFIFLVLLPIALLARVPLRKFIAAVAEPVSIAFGTATSEAALPRAMEAMEAIGVPRSIVAFVMPTGYSFNLDGSTLYLSLAAVFVAQVAGIPLSFGQELKMMLTLMLTSKGVAGVSKASLVILLGAADSLGLPAQPILILFAVDQLLDMARTAINVLGNCLATVVIARWEGEFPAKTDSVEA